jgi:hypothetical protein
MGFGGSIRCSLIGFMVARSAKTAAWAATTTTTVTSARWLLVILCTVVSAVMEKFLTHWSCREKQTA